MQVTRTGEIQTRQGRRKRIGHAAHLPQRGVHHLRSHRRRLLKLIKRILFTGTPGIAGIVYKGGQQKTARYQKQQQRDDNFSRFGVHAVLSPPPGRLIRHRNAEISHYAGNTP